VGGGWKGPVGLTGVILNQRIQGRGRQGCTSHRGVAGYGRRITVLVLSSSFLLVLSCCFFLLLAGCLFDVLRQKKKLKSQQEAHKGTGRLNLFSESVNSSPRRRLIILDLPSAPFFLLIIITFIDFTAFFSPELFTNPRKR
jgi:hypothetical protein